MQTNNFFNFQYFKLGSLGSLGMLMTKKLYPVGV